MIEVHALSNPPETLDSSAKKPHLVLCSFLSMLPILVSKQLTTDGMTLANTDANKSHFPSIFLHSLTNSHAPVTVALPLYSPYRIPQSFY